MTAPDQLWTTPPLTPRLSSTDVQVWCAALDRPAAQIEALAMLLAPDESVRAARFYFPKDRNHFIASRGLLRTMLGRYLGVAPQQVQFGYTSHGKPTLVSPVAPMLRFNVSHAHGMALFGFTHGREIGVDIEQIRTIEEREQIAERFFSAQDNLIFLSVDPGQRDLAFFNCWTRKEAYIKARGEGLSLPLDQFDVTLAPGDPAELLATRPDPAEAQRWQMQALEPAPGYVAALCVEGYGWQTTCWRWPD